jgi:hypothetical protein
MLKNALLILLLGTSLSAHAQTVALGTAVVAGACAGLDDTQESHLLIYNQRSNSVRYTDGTVETSVTIVPTSPLPNDAAQELMTRCARETNQQLDDRHAAAESIVPEDAFKDRLNQCLRSNKAGFQASFVILRRSDVFCRGNQAPNTAHSQTEFDQVRSASEWRERYNPGSTDMTYNVIVASPGNDQQRAQQVSMALQRKYPNAFFSAVPTASADRKNEQYAVYVGTNLSKAKADQLSAWARSVGMSGAYPVLQHFNAPP